MNQQGRAALSGWAQRWRRGEVTSMMFLTDECREDLENVIDRIVADATERLVEERRILWGMTVPVVCGRCLRPLGFAGDWLDCRIENYCVPSCDEAGQLALGTPSVAGHTGQVAVDTAPSRQSADLAPDWNTDT